MRKIVPVLVAVGLIILIAVGFVGFQVPVSYTHLDVYKRQVESHVLRYWEEELEMNIPRNEMGHRYYTDFHIRLFKQIKELKEKGYQLKAIKTALAKTLDAEGESVAPTDVLEEDVMTALKECTEQEKRDLEKLDPGEAAELMNREKAEQFREFLTQMIGQAIEENNEKLSQDISRMVNDKVLKERCV